MRPRHRAVSADQVEQLVDPAVPGSARRPSTLRRLGGDALAVLLIGGLLWVLLRLAKDLSIVVVPVGVALLFTALLRPLVNRLSRRGLGRGAATALVVLGFWAVLAALGYVVTLRASGQVPRLVDEATGTIEDLRRSLANGPFDITDRQVNDLSNRAIAFLQAHRGALTGSALTGVRVLLEAATGLVLAVFVGIYLIYDGSGVWTWLVGHVVPRDRREQADAFGHAAYHALAGYLRGQLIVALFHGTVIASVLLVLRVPLALPLAVLVAIGSLVPLVGAFVAGGLAVVVTFATHGPLLALVVAGVLLVENQVEAHLLQPFVVGRSVELHPLAVALGLATATVLAGIWGALFVVPLLAALHAGWKALADDPGPVPYEGAERPGSAQRDRARGSDAS